jgi:hypothetical protein
MRLYILLILVLISLQIGCESKDEEKILPERKPSLPPTEQTQKPSIEQKNVEPEIAAEIIAVVKENIDASNNEDVERVLSTVHPDSPQLKSTKEGMEFVFRSYDLKFIIEEINVVEVDGENAKVYYVQFTTNTGGQQFADSRSAGMHVMKKFNGKWKIFKTERL